MASGSKNSGKGTTTGRTAREKPAAKTKATSKPAAGKKAGVTVVAKTPPAVKRKGKTAAPTHAQVAARAYDIWQRSGCPTGQDVQIWRAAECELGG